MPRRALTAGFSMARSLPKELPAKARPFHHTQYVLLPGESATAFAADLLVPIPFVVGALEGAANKHTATTFEARYEGVRPFYVFQDVMQGSPLLGRGTGEGEAFKIQPFVFIQECADDRYRLSFVAHITGGQWVGRYTVHLPTAFDRVAFKAATPEVLVQLNRDLTEGAKVLRKLVERAVQNDFKPAGGKVSLGSLHLVGGRALGVLSPTLMKGWPADLIEEGPAAVIVRLEGDMGQAASGGGLVFGVHWFQRDQLYAFEKVAPKP